MTDLVDKWPKPSRNKLETGVRSAFETPQWYFDKLNYRVRLRADVVSELVRDLPFKRIFDIGCGDGSISLPLLDADRQLTLLDVSSAMLARARSKVPPHLAANVNTVCSDFRQAELKAGAFDLILCLGVLSYVDSIPTFLNKLASLVQPGGHVIIECTDGAHFMTRLSSSYSSLRSLVAPPKVNIKLHAYSSAEIAASLIKFGFVVKTSYRYSAPPPVIRRLFSQQFHYQMNRIIHGCATRNRTAWLGTECIFFLQKMTGRQKNG
jgi:ubiquinone/menaquinone biosynthesis C-methylase UbiE